MKKLTPDEQTVFLNLYSGEGGERPDPPNAIESLARRGLLKLRPDGGIGRTVKGAEFYQLMQDDEPYEGV